MKLKIYRFPFGSTITSEETRRFQTYRFVQIYECSDCKNAYVTDQLTRSDFYLILASVKLQLLAKTAQTGLSPMECLLRFSTCRFQFLWACSFRNGLFAQFFLVNNV